MIGPHHRQVSISDERLDDYLLKLILIDTLAVTDSRRSPAAERAVAQMIPAPVYERVVARYDDLSDDSDDERDLLPFWQERAAARCSEWKAATLALLLRVVTINGVLEPGGLDEVCRLADAIGAGRELEAVLNLP